MARKQHSTIANNKVILFDGDHQRYFDLDTLAALVWKLGQQPVTLHEMVEVVVERFGLDPEAAEKNLLDVLNEMQTQGLIETA